MAVSAKLGSFTTPTVTNTSFAITGVGFQPKAVLLFGNLQTSSGASTTTGINAAMAMTVLGMGVSSSAYGCIYSEDDFSGGDGHFRGDNIFSIGSNNDIATAGHRTTGTLVSLDSDGFTLNITCSGATAPTSTTMQYLALGGSSLSASIVKWKAPATATNKSFTGAGFQPECLINIGGSISGPQARGFGITDGTNQCGNTSAYDGVAPQRYQRVNKAYVEVNGNGTLRNEATIVSLDSDGATLNFTTTAGTGADIFSLCLRSGLGFKVGTFNLNTATGNQAITGTGFTPIAVLMSSVIKTAGTTVDGGRIVGNTSASAGPSNSASIMFGDNNNGVAAFHSARLIDLYYDNGTPSTYCQATLASFDSNGFTLNIGATDGATALEMIYLAIGGAVAGNTYTKTGTGLIG
jgi:hypothetical protein